MAETKAVLFAPHNDDETLFAFYQCLRRKPKVIVCLQSFRQLIHQNGPPAIIRENETAAAMNIADCEYEQWEYADHNPDWVLVASSVEAELYTNDYSVVIAPAWEAGGHDDHNAIASIVAGLTSTDSTLVRYLTYRRGNGRSHWGTEIVATEEEQDLKRQALGCYQSQIEHPLTSAWFDPAQYGDLREWVT